MKQATITYEGKKLKLSCIYWSYEGAIAHVAFDDENGDTVIAFQCWKSDYEGIDKESGLLYLDLIDRVEEG